jgi:hypothetical protein
MQCEGYIAGCKSQARHSVQGYDFCTPCAQAFAGYTPELTPLARARDLLFDSAVSLDPMASEILAGLFAELLRTVQEDAFSKAAAHIDAAMDDVERADARLGMTARMTVEDVRRLAAELRLY